MARQYGLIARNQALGLGLSPDQIDRRVTAGEWRIARRGVYAAMAAPATREQALMAVVLAIGEGALLSHRSAGSLWRFRGIDADLIEVSAALERRVDLDGVVGHRSCLLFDEDRGRQRGIPVTSKARTIVDLTGSYGAKQLGPILDDALRHGLRLRDVHRCAGRLGPAPGRRMSVIYALLATRLDGYEPGDSDLETRVIRVLIAAGLPPPRQQYRVRIAGRTYKIDLAYPGLRIAIELDGWDSHSTRTAFDYDRSRANALVLAGWTLFRFTSTSTDSEVVAFVRAALAAFGGLTAA